MSEEAPDWHQRLCHEAENEVFRNRLAEWNQCEALLGEPINPLDMMDRKNGVAVTQSDRERQKLREMIAHLGFNDSEMKSYGTKKYFERHDPIDRAKELITSTNTQPQDRQRAIDFLKAMREEIPPH
jgi:hypothetical protein